VSSWWIDPVVGLRVGGDLTENLSLTVTGNVGGFDIGSASKFSWEVLALLGYRLGEHWSVTAGYRGLGVERQKGDTSVNLILHGPQVGLYYRF
jgi:opacity protein-like surface antigen